MFKLVANVYSKTYKKPIKIFPFGLNGDVYNVPIPQIILMISELPNF